MHETDLTDRLNKRIGRVFGILEDLWSGPRTVEELTARYGCSWRTIHRDIQALRMQGFDIRQDSRKKWAQEATFKLSSIPHWMLRHGTQTHNDADDPV